MLIDEYIDRFGIRYSPIASGGGERDHQLQARALFDRRSHGLATRPWLQVAALHARDQFGSLYKGRTEHSGGESCGWAVGAAGGMVQADVHDDAATALASRAYLMKFVLAC